MALNLVQSGLRCNTKRTYNTAQRFYLSFCATHLLTPFPATELQLLRFVSYAHTKGLSVATIHVYLSGISSLHTINGLPAPPLDAYRLKLALRALHQASSSPARRAPITYELLSYMYHQLQSSTTGYLWQAMLTLGFFGALRGSEYAAVCLDGAIQAPLVRHIRFIHRGTTMGLVFTIVRSKTTHKPIHRYIGCSGTQICAVCCLITYFKIQRSMGLLHENSYLFTFKDARPVTKCQLNAQIKSLAASLGLPAASYTSHSLRAGAATTASSLGFTQPEIKRLGHWASDAYNNYIHMDYTQQLGFASRLTQKPS